MVVRIVTRNQPPPFNPHVRRRWRLAASLAGTGLLGWIFTCGLATGGIRLDAAVAARLPLGQAGLAALACALVALPMTWAVMATIGSYRRAGAAVGAAVTSLVAAAGLIAVAFV